MSQVTAKVDWVSNSQGRTYFFTKQDWLGSPSGQVERVKLPNAQFIMCTLIITMLNLFVSMSSPIFIGIQTVTAVSHQQRSTLTWQPAVLEVDPVLCLDSAISLSKPNKSPQCDPYQVFSGCENCKLQIHSFCKGTRPQGKSIFLLFLCFRSVW